LFGIHSEYVLIVGESRAPRESLFDAVTRSFRRVVDLNSLTSEGRAEILRVQLAQSRQFASEADQQHDKGPGIGVLAGTFEKLQTAAKNRGTTYPIQTQQRIWCRTRSTTISVANDD
ncbi:MAG: hypothetical protein AABZ71_02300, partial [Candidatus Binatota bacterium]